MNSKAINPLPTNKTVVFYSPIEGKDVLVRTGNDSDLLHCVLSSYSKKFLFMSQEKKEKALKKLKVKLDVQDKNKVNTTDLRAFYTSIKNKKSISHNLIKNKNDTIVFETLFDILSLREVLSLNSCESAKKYLEPKVSSLPQKQKEYCLTKFSELYKNDLSSKKSDKFTDTKETISTITDKLNRNIFFLDCKTRLPYKVLDKVGSKKSMIIMNVGNGFEIVGRLLNGNVVQREFKFDDPLIKRIYTLLYEPSLIPKKYPELTAYIDDKDKKVNKEENKVVNRDKKRKEKSKTKSKSKSKSSESETSESSESESEHTKRKSSSPNLRSNSESPSTLQSLDR